MNCPNCDKKMHNQKCNNNCCPISRFYVYYNGQYDLEVVLHNSYYYFKGYDLTECYKKYKLKAFE